jgi:Fe2+ transport system protein FeoA
MSAVELPAETTARLSELQPGDKATVVQLAAALDDTRSQLADLGLSPGLEVHVLQCRPALVIELDCTVLAVEDSVARHVLVDRLPPQK